MRNVRRVRWYRSADRDLPLEVWEMVADLPIFASNFHDNTPNETKKTHYYTCRYVFADGCLRIGRFNVLAPRRLKAFRRVRTLKRPKCNWIRLDHALKDVAIAADAGQAIKTWLFADTRNSSSPFLTDDRRRGYLPLTRGRRHSTELVAASRIILDHDFSRNLAIPS